MTKLSQVLFRQMQALQLDSTTALDVVADGEEILCFLGQGSAPGNSMNGVPVTPLRELRMAGGLLLAFTAEDFPGDIEKVSHPEPDLLAGRNVIVATHNGEDVASIMEWLTYHHDHFDVSGVVLIARERAAETDELWAELSKSLMSSKLRMNVLVFRSPTPLGKPGLPPEPHRFCVPEAPGRDRMVVPQADPWTAPLGEIGVYEIIRARFLAKARAVANIDLHDLLRLDSGVPSPFDTAVNAPGCVVKLIGRHCHPWQVPKGERPAFSDHVCVQFDTPQYRARWCVAPMSLPRNAVLKLTRVSETSEAAIGAFDRFMAVRHSDVADGPIVPKSSLIEDKRLVHFVKNQFGRNPKRPADMSQAFSETTGSRTTVVSCMKNEGPFLLEWLAFHRAIGVENFLIYTNDCTDGTDAFLKLLDSKGIVQHRENPFRSVNMKPQHAALMAASDEAVLKEADWLISMDVDEFINIKVGDGRLEDLYAAVGDANMISLTWRLFGNSGLHKFRDDFILGQFDRCAEENAPKPHQAWGFKTLFRNNGIYKKLGVHRPKGLHPQLIDEINWVNGSGKPMPKQDYRNAWRSTSKTVGYDLVALNHYAVRNAESFLVKRDRGRVNHTDRDQGLGYWFRMNANSVRDTSIMSRIPMMEREYARLMSDPEVAQQQAACVAAHQARIESLLKDEAQAAFFKDLTSARMEQLSTMHRHFGSNVFYLGPGTVPDEVVWRNHEENFFFTVPLDTSIPQHFE